mgnify:CR=1 FL=1
MPSMRKRQRSSTAIRKAGPTGSVRSPPKKNAAWKNASPRKRKNSGSATLCWFFGLHYFYLGNSARNLFYLMTVGGCFLWMLFDLYRLPAMVDESNAKIAEEVYKELKKG